MKKGVFRLVMVLMLLATIIMPAVPFMSGSMSVVEAASRVELIAERTENSKTFELSNGSKQVYISMGAIHYKQDYTNKFERWKDIDLTWIGNKITRAPYELTRAGKKITLRDKRTGNITTIELDSIGGKEIPTVAMAKSKGLARVSNIALDTDLEVVAEFGAVKFSRILKSDKAPLEAKFKVTGDTSHIRIRALDDEGENIPVESSLKDGILTEILKPDRPIKYPVRIDPTWQVGTGTDDCRRSLGPSDWSLASEELYAGAVSHSYNKYGSGMRFTNITIPQGSTIGDGTHFDARWANRTTARVDWDDIPAWTAGNDYDSPEIKTVIQEIVDRPGWASGQDMVIFWEDFEERSTYTGGAPVRFPKAYEKSSTDCPKLVIVFFVDPTITTNVASNIANTTARLNSTLTDDGGEPCEIRFGWDDTGSRAAITDYDHYTDYAGAYTSGQHPHLDIDSLVADTKYFFRVEAQNTEGSDLGDELDFTTTDAIGDPTDLRAYPSATSVSLSWAKGTGSTNSMLRYKIGSYPVDETDGMQVYFGTSASTVHEGLERGETIYYSVWGESGGVYSADSSDVMVTTLAGGAEGEALPTPTEPNRWMAAPNYENLSGLPIVYDAVNNAADTIEMPRATAWMILAIVGAFSMAIFFYSVTKKAFVGLAVMLLALVFGWAVQIVPFWIPLLSVITVIAILWTSRREVQ